jgi:glycosyltransferase involved in cell wall biosynthesis
MRVHVLDPPAYTPPYDHALCAALARAGAEVTLVTSRFAYGPVPPAEGYARRELFYRAALGPPASRLRAALKLAEHVPDMLRYRHRLARGADVIHFQWLPVQHLDGHLLPARRPRRAGGASAAAAGRPRPLVLTSHDILPREPRPGQLAAQRRLYRRFDAIVVHSTRGRQRLVQELGVEGSRVHVIPHGAFTHLAIDRDQSRGTPEGHPPAPGDAPRALGAISGEEDSERDGHGDENLPVVLFFGLLRPYKGLDLLLEAWRGIEDAELWIAGMPRMDISALRADLRSADPPANVRLIPRFITDAEQPAYFERAALVVLPYRQADQSGVAFTALGAGVPLLLSDVGGFPELAGTGAARTFPAGDVAALRTELRALLDEPRALRRMSAAARAAAAGPYSWDAVARATLGLYESLLA